MDKFTENSEALQERVVHISRVAKVVKGGRRFSFSALVISGDGQGRFGFGLGKAGEVPDAIRKGGEQCKKNLMEVPSVDGTIPFEVVGKYGSCRVVMNPAKKGRGIIAGGATRVICELAGIKDIVCKVHGTKNTSNVVRATYDGFAQLVSTKQYAAERGMDEGQLFRQLRKNRKNTSTSADSSEATA